MVSIYPYSLSCLQCESSEDWGPLSQYFDFTPCFLYGALFNALSIFGLVAGSYVLYQLIFRNSTTLSNNTYKPDAFVISRFALIVFQFLLKFFLVAIDNGEYYLSSELIKFESFFELIVLFVIILPLTYLDFKKLQTSSAVLLIYWLAGSLLHFFKVFNLSVRYFYQSHSLQLVDDLFITKINVTLTVLTFINSVFILITQSVPKKMTPSTTLGSFLIFQKEKENPLDSANVLSILYFGWMTKLMKLGYSKYLTLNDLPNLPKGFENGLVTTSLAEHYEKEIANFKAKKSKHVSLFKCILKSFGYNVFIAACFKCVSDVLNFTQPQLLKALIKFVNDFNSEPDDIRPPLIKGFAIAFGMLFVSIIQGCCINQYFFNTYSSGIKIKSSLIGFIYDKSLVLSPESRNKKSTGDIVNLMSIDTQRIQDITEFGQVIWSAPFQIILCLISLYRILKNSMWFGFAIMAIMVVVNTSLVRFQKKLQKKQMKFKDTRIKVISEILSNIKSLKLYNWENPYRAKLDHWRNDKELKNMAQISVFKAINMSMWNMIPFFVSCSTFIGFIKIYDQPLTTDIVFPALALFNLLGFPLNVIPNVITAIIDCGVSLDRLNEFLQLDELDPNAVIRMGKVKKMGEEVVKFDNCSYSWNKFNQRYSDADTDANNSNNYLALKNINFVAKKGELSCVIGKVGSGKSSFIKSMLGDLYKYQGQLSIHGKVAYVSQVAWIMNGTIKENILFGHKYDPILYEKVLFACDLNVDLKNFVDGDLTQVGEKGISLSGGQKARLSLARAIYAGADLYLLDDPLAAVDEHVGKHLIDHVFGEKGMLHHKCKVLVTNSVHFLHIAHNISMLEDGEIIEQTSTKALNEMTDEQRSTSKISQLIEQFGKKKVDGSSETEDEESSVNEDANKEEESSDNGDQDDVKTFKGHELVEDNASIENDLLENNDAASLRRASTATMNDAVVTYDDERNKTSEARKEHMERGNVKWDVYLTYANACNPRFVVLFLFLAVSNMGLNVAANYWLKYWSELNSKEGYNPHVVRYLSIYALLGISGSITLMIQCIILWNVCVIKGSKNLHNRLANAVIRAPMSFFETTPIGRILNRFSNDINKIDDVLGRVFQSFFQQSIKVLFTILVICFSTWQFVLVIVPLSVLYIYYQQYYMRTSRELKRLESITRSPIYAHFQETLNGITTIRGFGQENRFVKLNEVKVDNNLEAYHSTVNCNRWLATRLDFLASLVIFSSAALPMFGLASGKVSAGLIGLSVSYALQITGSLNWTVRMTVEVETNIVSVERIEEYSKLEPEAPEVIESNRPADAWPTEGAIEFKGYSTRYRKELDLVLKNISLKINPREKIGIVGRTGAGKSSLTMALYRIIEPAEGEVVIDGMSTSAIGLADLRRKLSIIPQDAQVFEGTIRDNLDPTSSFDDKKILKSIELSHMKPHLLKMIDEQNAASPDTKINDLLSVRVTENGGNLSVGQKQLMCLARALLIPSKILVLDEATAAVDVETDKIVQETIRKEFSERTILTIAHRINTIMDSDRILVLEKGEVAEFDKPEVLLQNHDSIFYSLAKRGGLVE
ncbi:ATP-binding cassette glutathione S-conjugate transporter [Saccharomycopsis crataegensis]|uniref:ATP-binding cassette glutathione S-conjugate transporter n=1 Tax=Saccharomycopsis crataegensis TaxID=43959 RepID=A0AAV5QHA9_9ASCO|nr:ATP-binding cassette glutathione S-conjugate transporter [Saccharomycopsis crataegensis]